MALRNSQYDLLIRSYNQKQLKHRHELNQRTQRIYEQIPRIEEISHEIASTSVAQARELLKGNTYALKAGLMYGLNGASARFKNNI